MSSIEKLKSRTEWQAFLVMMVTTFAAFFFGLELDPEQFEKLFDMLGLAWGGTASYGVSRGLGKMGKTPAPVAAAAPVAATPEPAPAPADPEPQPGTGSDAVSDEEE